MASSNPSETSSSSLVGPKVISAEFYTSTIPLPPRPFQYLPIPQADATKWPNIVQETSNLLSGWDFDWQSVDMINVQLTKSGSLQPRLRIGVLSTKDHSRWEEIIVLLYRAMPKTNEYSQLGLDIESPNPNSIFVIRRDHPFVVTWSNLREKVLSSLREYEWKAIDVFLYGETT